MILSVEPAGSGLQGEITPPGDKSISHRALIFSSLASGRSELSGLLESEDTLATLRACEQLGAIAERQPGRIFITGTGGVLKAPAGGLLDMGNSGTAMRLLAGVLSGQNFDCTLAGDASLNSRPMRRIVVPLTQMGADISATEAGTAPLVIRACQGLRGIDYVSPVSSAQIKSCVLLAGLFASGATHVDEPHLSRDHTERMLPIFGVDLPSPRTVVGGSRLTAARFAVPADISSAVFMLATAAMTPGSEVVVRQVGLNPTRTGFLRCLEAMGAGPRITNQSAESTEPVGDLHLAYKGPLRAIDVPESLIPDMIDELPMLMAMAVTASGVTRIRGAAELRVKESDRIAVMAHGLAALGVRNEVLEDGLRIEGGRFARGTVDSVGDHRVAMAFALASLRADGPIEILDTANVATSFPGFPALARSVGLSIEEGA